jgi:methionyl-tRNA formyltransferase
MRIVFMGSAEVSCIMLEALLRAPDMQVVGVVTQPDKPAGRHRHLTPCPARALAASRNLPVIAPEKLNREEPLAQIEAWHPDVIAVVAYGHILRKRLLDLPRLGCVNIHLSLLPRHRGAAPVQWAIAAGDTMSGVTAMRMDEGMDTGDILGQVEEPIRDGESAGSLYDRLAPLGAELLVKTLKDLESGRAVRTPQDHTRATLAPKIHKEDGWIDWTLPAVQIARRVRAFNPWPSCHTTLPERLQSAQHQRLKVLQAAACPAIPGVHAPGAMAACDNAGPLIQTGEGTLRLLSVQLEGKKPMTGNAFLCGHALWPGDVFGQSSTREG